MTDLIFADVLELAKARGFDSVHCDEFGNGTMHLSLTGHHVALRMWVHCSRTEGLRALEALLHELPNQPTEAIK